jgi:hypothetical protein
MPTISLKSIYFFLSTVFLLSVVSCSKNQYLSGNDNFEEASAKASGEIESSTYYYSYLNKEELSKKETAFANNEIVKGKSAKPVKEEIAPFDESNQNVKEKIKQAKTLDPTPLDEKPVKKTNKNALKAFFLSVVGFFIPVLGIIFMSIGFAKGIKAMNEIRKNRRENKGMGFALAAWIIPIAFIVLLLVAAYIYLLLWIYSQGD